MEDTPLGERDDTPEDSTGHPHEEKAVDETSLPTLDLQPAQNSQRAQKSLVATPLGPALPHRCLTMQSVLLSTQADSHEMGDSVDISSLLITFCRQQVRGRTFQRGGGEWCKRATDCYLTIALKNHYSVITHYLTIVHACVE